MASHRITTSQVIYREYEVEANTPEQAIEFFNDSPDKRNDFFNEIVGDDGEVYVHIDGPDPLSQEDIAYEKAQHSAEWEGMHGGGL